MNDFFAHFTQKTTVKMSSYIARTYEIYPYLIINATIDWIYTHALLVLRHELMTNVSKLKITNFHFRYAMIMVHCFWIGSRLFDFFFSSGACFTMELVPGIGYCLCVASRRRYIKHITTGIFTHLLPCLGECLLPFCTHGDCSYENLRRYIDYPSTPKLRGHFCDFERLLCVRFGIAIH